MTNVKHARIKDWQSKNPEKVKVYRKRWRDKNPEKVKSYYAKNKASILVQQVRYQKENRRHSLYVGKRELVDPHFKLANRLRSRLRSALKGKAKTGSAVENLGCTLEELRLHLEIDFQEGMTWENWGRWGWHIDHKVPLASFDLSDSTQLLQAVHFTNLQPLWAHQNLRKKDSVS